MMVYGPQAFRLDAVQWDRNQQSAVFNVVGSRPPLEDAIEDGLDGMKRWVGRGVSANNLVSTATASRARATA